MRGDILSYSGRQCMRGKQILMCKYGFMIEEIVTAHAMQALLEN